MKILNFILGLLTAVVSILLGLSLLAPYVSPQLLWPLAILGLAFVPLFLLNFVLLIYWASQLKLRAFLPAVVLMLALPYAKRIFNYNGEGMIKGEGIIVISHNTRAFHNDKQKRLEAEEYLQELKAQNASIICFQEYGDWYVSKKKSHADNVQHVLGMKLYGNSRFRDLYKNLVIATNHKVIATKSKYFEGGGANGIMRADIVLPSKDTIRVINFHLESIGLSSREALRLEDISEGQEKAVAKSKNLLKRLKRAFENRAMQVNLLCDWIEESPYPLILCGDMNDTPVSFAYQRISHQLQDAFNIRGSGLGRTYQGPWPSYRIDYILADTKFDIVSYQTLPAFHSDHKPVAVKLFLTQSVD